MTKLVISVQEKKEIMKIDQSFDESGLLIKDISETNENEGRY